ncbi:MAG: hypothetical protein FWG10_08520 [Eubacteriaceae bacterium]|nr:hypothetical protein [Eubacteriaceae bacterium]
MKIKLKLQENYAICGTSVVSYRREIMEYGIRAKDALHIACARPLSQTRQQLH